MAKMVLVFTDEGKRVRVKAKGTPGPESEEFPSPAQAAAMEMLMRYNQAQAGRLVSDAVEAWDERKKSGPAGRSKSKGG